MKETKKTEAPAVNLAHHARLAGIELVVNAAIEKHAADAALYVGLATTDGYDNAAYFAAKAAEEYHKAAAVAALRINLLPLLNGGGK